MWLLLKWFQTNKPSPNSKQQLCSKHHHENWFPTACLDGESLSLGPESAVQRCPGENIEGSALHTPAKTMLFVDIWVPSSNVRQAGKRTWSWHDLDRGRFHHTKLPETCKFVSQEPISQPKKISKHAWNHPSIRPHTSMGQPSISWQSNPSHSNSLFVYILMRQKIHQSTPRANEPTLLTYSKCWWLYHIINHQSINHHFLSHVPRRGIPSCGDNYEVGQDSGLKAVRDLPSELIWGILRI